MRISLWVAPVASVALLFGGVGIAQGTGQWVTSGRQAVVPGVAITVDDLKGWMTIADAATGLGIGPDEIIALLPAAPDGTTITAATAFKDLEGLVPGFELTAFREVLRVHLAGGTVSSAPASAPKPTPVATASAAPTHEATGSPTQAISGQSTLRQVAQANGLDPGVLAREAGLPEGTDLDATLKSLRDANPGWEIQAVRDAVTRLA